jgi:hypothetical protein
MVRLPRVLESSGVPQSLPMRMMSWSKVLQEPADLVEVWEHDRVIMQENGIEGQIGTKRVEVGARWLDGVSRICGRMGGGRIAAPHRGKMALREGARGS